MVTKNDRPRRNLKSTLIEPFKQIKFGLYVLGISVAFVVVCGFMIVNAFTDQYRHVMGIFSVVNPELQWELVLNDVFYTNAKRIGLVFVTFFVVLFSVVFRLTHRYYGPLVSVERFVDHVIKGEYHCRLKIRDKDELQGLVHKLNAMAEALEKRHGSDRRGAGTIEVGVNSDNAVESKADVDVSA